jgi:hypothetical protein
MRRMGIAIAVVLLGGCGSDTRTAAPAAHGHASGTRVLVRAAHLHGGAHGVRLLAIPGLGRVLASCDTDGGARIAFVGGRLLASADAVVESGGDVAEGIIEPGVRFRPSFDRGPRIEQWQIAEFSEAQAAVVTMTVAVRAVDPPPGGCAVSVQATVSTPQAGTLTR